MLCRSCQERSASEIAGGIAPTELGRLYIGEGDNTDEVKVGIERGANNPVFATAPLKLNQTYLVVLRYEINAANPRQDNIYLYVNPTDFKQEPKLDKASAVIDGVNKTGSGLGSYGLQGLELRQGTTSSVTSPEMYVASVRVSDTYAGLFGEAGVDTTPKLGVSKKTFCAGRGVQWRHTRGDGKGDGREPHGRHHRRVVFGGCERRACHYRG